MYQALDKQWRKLIKPKVGDLKGLIKIDKLLQKKKTNYQYQGEKRTITTDPVDIERIIRQQYKKCNSNKFNSLDETDIIETPLEMIAFESLAWRSRCW